jgi:hypothetical protein
MRGKKGWPKFSGAIVAAAAMVLMVSVASADPIGPTCTGFSNPEDTCSGNIFTLEFTSLTDVAGPTTTLHVILTIDTANYVDPGQDTDNVIRDVAVKISSNDALDADLTVAPGGTGGWTTLLGGLANNGCAVGDNGFFCSQDSDLALIDGGILTWEWDVVIGDGTLLTASGGASVKARYCVEGTDCNGSDFEGITSEPITLQEPPTIPTIPTIPTTPQIPTIPQVPTTVPQPVSLVLLGAGLLMSLAAASGVRSLRRKPRR